MKTARQARARRTPKSLVVADVERAFFDTAPALEPLFLDAPEPPAPVSPETLQARERARVRRVRFARYVRVIVVGAAALFAIGLARTTFFGASAAPDREPARADLSP